MQQEEQLQALDTITQQRPLNTPHTESPQNVPASCTDDEDMQSVREKVWTICASQSSELIMLKKVLAATRSELASATAKMSEMSAQEAETRSKTEHLVKRLSETREDAAKQSKEERSRNEEIESMCAEYHKGQVIALKGQLNEARDELIMLRKDLAATKSEVASATAKMSEMSAQEVETKSRTQDLVKRLSETREEAAKQSKEERSRNEEVEGMCAEYHKGQVVALQGQLNEARDELSSAIVKLKMQALDHEQEVKLIKWEHELECNRLHWDHEQVTLSPGTEERSAP